MLNIGGWELMIILLVALVVLGPQRLPEVARQMGQTMSTLRSLASNFQSEIEAAAKPDIDTSMSLAGPTAQDEAIAQTQPAATTADDAADDAVTASDGGSEAAAAGDASEAAAAGDAADEAATASAAAGDGADDGEGGAAVPETSAPIVTSAPFAAVKTDPADIAAQARDVTYDDDREEPSLSAGGPTDLRDDKE